MNESASSSISSDLNTRFEPEEELVDRFDRRVSYLRLSVTDRCDFRCVYCMAEDMTFMPRDQVLSFEESFLVCQAFVGLGVKKIRITGGEPLIRRDIVSLLRDIRQIPGLEELCLTTNGSRLQSLAPALKDAGVNRINISLDTLKAQRFKDMTRVGNLENVLAGIDQALRCNFDRIKINSVLLQQQNLDEASELAKFALNKNCDISFIEEMPLGKIDSHDRKHEFISSEDLKDRLSKDFDFIEQEHHNTDTSAGPSRYWSIKGQTARIGFISPHSENFCSNCNRVRVTASGRLLLCLGNEHSVDLRSHIRDENFKSLNESAKLTSVKRLIQSSMAIKPEKHEFDLNDEPQILRFMNTTGG